MAGVDLQVTLEGEKQVSRRLLIIADGISNFETPLKSIGGELQKTFQTNFAQQGTLFGGWAERKPQYRDGQRIDTWPLLNQTGALKSGFRQDTSKTNLRIRNVVPYFKYHQSNQPRTRLPRRVMMKIDNERRNYIVKAFQKYIVDLKRK